MDFLLSCDEININNRNFSGETALFWAAKRGHLHLVERLVKANANVNLSNYEDVTPLHISANFPQVVHVLIKSGAKLDAVDYSGETALHEAISEHCLESVCMLLYYGADPNVQCGNGITPFMKAILLDDIEIQHALFNYVYDFNTTTQDGMTLLNLALTHSCPYVEEIIDGGADVNYKHPYLNAFIMCLEVPNVTKFALIWKNFRYQKLYTSFSYLHHMIALMEQDDFIRYLYVIFNSGHFTPIFEHFEFNSIFDFINTKVNDKLLWYPIVYDLIFIYLSFGYALESNTLHQLFILFGYDTLLYICLHMDVRESSDVCISFARLLFDTKLSVKDFKNSLAASINENPAIPLQQYLPFIRMPEIRIPVNYPEEYKRHLKNLSQLPSLLELARNSTRDHLVRKFDLYKPKQYYLFVKSMQISVIYRKILTFQRDIYFPETRDESDLSDESDTSTSTSD